MGLYRIGKYWHYDFRYKGKRYKASTKQTSKTAAAEVEVAVRRGIREGGVQDITFEQLAKKYLKLHAKNKRGKAFFEHTVAVLRREFDKTMLSAIGAREVDAFMATRRVTVATATANRSLAVLKHMFKLAIRWGHLGRNPAADLRPEREKNRREFFLDEEQAVRLLAEVPGWLRPLVLAALHTGARRGELLGLHWGDVNLERSEVTFRATKNGEPRTVRLSATLREALRETPSRFRGGSVFRNAAGEPLMPKGISWAFERAVERAKLDGFRFHDLRHSAASFMVQGGIPLNTVRDILGHKSLEMTLRYAHLAPDHQADAVAVMDQLSGREQVLQAVRVVE